MIAETNFLHFLLLQEKVSQERQRAYFRRIERKMSRKSVKLPEIYMAKPDRVKLVALFYNVVDNRVNFHLVYNDEYLPIPVLDKVYREFRKKTFGRTADIESVSIENGFANFITTYSGFNIYMKLQFILQQRRSTEKSCGSILGIT